MQLFCVKPKVHCIDTFAAFAAEFALGPRDLLLTETFLYERFIKAAGLSCPIILKDKYDAGEPKEETVDQILADMQPFQIDRVVAVGGGSVIDIAKVLIIRDARPIGRIIRGEQPFETDKQLIILPTTCGTGSEVTFGGIITMKDTGLKTAIMDERLSADHAVLVPELVAELPIKFFIHCSVDALGHSMESYVSAARGNEMARAVGARAVQLILNGYRQLIEKGAAYKALLAKDFIQASCLAGMAVNNGGAGPVHALAYPLGEKYKISHGESIYQFLTAVFSIYDQIRPEGALAELKDIVEKPLQEAGFAGEAPVFERLEKMLNQLYPNRPLRETGMTEQDIKPFTESIFASKQRLLVASYVPFTREQAAEIYRRRF